MANSTLATDTRYKHKLHDAEPLKFFIALMDLKPFQNELTNEPKALVILSGIAMYRSLPRQRQMHLLQEILALPNKRLSGHLYGIVGQFTANTAWHPWSMTAKELQSYFASNKAVSDALTEAGFGTPSVSAAAVVGGIYGGLTLGLGGQASATAASAATSNPLLEVAKKLGLKGRITKIGGRMLGVFVIAVIGLNMCATTSAKQAKKELALRGMLDLADY
ncbi:hypothetical protein [Agarivorans gilvus]|uniref:Uncharacterized protein n=1 Tax=Agarivorans gilvus TaxID=680279 RepID=A0ABQ1HW40_9ALTE|nr:hypothetical protein [Agarivorans gilvus]GGA92137.1 hypothetical protein GCM10007414_00960 [Agarivorans gilvus]